MLCLELLAVRAGTKLWLVAVVALLGVLAAPAGAVTSEDERQREIAKELERLAERVDEAASHEAGALAELEVTRRAKAQLDVALIGLDRRITAAEDDLATSERALAAAVSAHEQAAGQLQAARARVDESQQVLRDQAVSRFMRYGVEASTVDVFLEVRDLRSLHDAAAFVGAVADFQGEVVRHHRSLQADTAELERRSEAARHEAGARRQEVAAHTRELQAARAGQLEALSQVEAEEGREEQVVTSVRSTRDDHEARIAALEAESQKITVLLQERQAARAAADAAAAAKARTDERATGQPAPEGDDRRGPARPAGAVTPAGSKALAYPLANPVVTSGYGYRIHPIYGTRRLHAGVDLRGATGTTVLAAGDGTVVFAGLQGGYGNTVVIDHGGAVATLYAHQSRVAVSAGDAVRRGQGVGAVGSTGLSTAPHLHFEVRVDGTPVDPLNYL